MMEGTVSSSLQPLLPLKIYAPTDMGLEVIALIDTGFSGCLTLPIEEIKAMELAFDRRETYTVGDNEDVLFELYTGAKVRWHKSEKDVVVMAVDGEAVLGMELMRDSRLMVEAKIGGRVQISTLEQDTETTEA